LFHCLIVCLSYLPALHNIFHTPMARCNLFTLKVSLNTNKPTDLLPRYPGAQVFFSRTIPPPSGGVNLVMVFCVAGQRSNMLADDDV